MLLFDKDAKPHPTLRHAVTIISILMAGAITISGLAYAMSKQVSIKDDDEFYEGFTTFKTTTAEILQEKDIVLYEKDEVNFGLDEKVPDKSEIIISRAVVIHIIDGEDGFLTKTAKKTVREVLAQAEIPIGDDTILNVTLDDAVSEGLTIKIIHTKEEILETEEIIPFKVTKAVSTDLKGNETRVKQEGSEGLLHKKYRVYYENNKEISRELIETVVVKEAVDKITEYAPPPPAKVAVTFGGGGILSRGGDFGYRNVLTCDAYAYYLPGNKTASGLPAQVGHIAVDPKVIPLGTKLYIEAADGSWTYGYAIAADTGSSIKGNKIDLFMGSYNETIKFGRRTANVYILD